MKKVPPTVLVARRAASTTTILVCLLAAGGLRSIQSAVPCNDTATCEILLRPGAVCGPKGMCTNPFAQGCLRRVLGEDYVKRLALPLRACNSDDDGWDGGSPHPPSSQCSVSDFRYPEVRISYSNWESSIFLGWMLQILLSELLGVPATIETGKSLDEGAGSFYDSNLDFTYGTAYNWKGLNVTSHVASGDCRLAESGSFCHHVIPEVWSGQIREWTTAQEEGIIEPVSSIDVVGKLGIFVPRFTAERYPSLTSVQGLSGEKYRKKLAAVFKHPTTWDMYCEKYSPTRCKYDDGVATRGPADKSEGSVYYSKGGYRGHFRSTYENNCTVNDNCAGHFVDAPCEWSTFAQGQLYWSNVTLKPEAYNWNTMTQIWDAANETKSDLIMWFYLPGLVPNIYRGTQGEFVPVSFDEPSLECAAERLDLEGRCSPDQTIRRGKPQGACDYEATVLKKAISTELKKAQKDLPEVSRSAAYNLIKDFYISDLVVDHLLSEWFERGIDPYGYDPREAVCSWVAENVDKMRLFVPEGYPRKIRDEGIYDQGYHYVALALGGFTVVTILLAVALTYLWRAKRVIRCAQPDFLALILFGYLLVAGGSIVYATEPLLATCVLRNWLVMLGYSFELVPLIVKVAAINQLLQKGKKMRRVMLTRTSLFRVVGIFLCFVVTYLIIWTALDPPTRQDDPIITSDRTEADGLYVEVQVECSSSSHAWDVVAYLWQVILLFCATVLGFQNRNVRQDFNESQRLAIMTYSHFIFVVLRIVIVTILPSVIAPEVRAAATSFLLSFDTLASLTIYFSPKFIEAMRRQGNELPGVMASTRQISSQMSQSSADEHLDEPSFAMNHRSSQL